MDFLHWLQATRHMTDNQRGRYFNGLPEADQIELMTHFAKSVRITRSGNLSHRFKGVKA